jgi:hypothetical protein
MKHLLYASLLTAAVFPAQQCTDASEQQANPASSTEKKSASQAISLPNGFGEYWYAGKAEICSYDVTQERYGEIREAEQVNIFVTEDFSGTKQVKLDNAAAAGQDRVPVLKLNLLRRFKTGIYDYSIMQSVFTPISGQPTLKSTCSVQDWCGQVFLQHNLESNEYRSRGFSYFESEGDQDIKLPICLLEDELWSRVRLNPAAIPTGSLRVIPSAIYTRLRHKPEAAQNAALSLEKGDRESTLKLVYAAIPRELRIRFETNFPHKILSWEETNESKLVSKGVLKASRMSAYWGEHDNTHLPLRDSLKLGF